MPVLNPFSSLSSSSLQGHGFVGQFSSFVQQRPLHLVKKTSDISNDNHGCDCDHHHHHPHNDQDSNNSDYGILQSDQDTDDNKYQKRRRRRRPLGGSSNTGSLVDLCLGIVFLLSAALILLLLLYWLITQARHGVSSEDAWGRFERAKTLLRQRGGGFGINRNPSWPKPWEPPSSSNQQQQQPIAEEAHVDEPTDADLQSLSLHDVVSLFDRTRPQDAVPRRLKFEQKNALTSILREWAHRLDDIFAQNTAGGIRWIRPYLLPPLDGSSQELVASPGYRHDEEPGTFFKVHRGHRFRQTWQWGKEWDAMKKEKTLQQLQPPVDYTKPHLYKYPALLSEPPAQGGYPQTTTLADLLRNWPQSQDILQNGQLIHEVLLHFNYSNPKERAMAERFRDARLPFKVYDIPDITRVTQLWTDDYVHEQFDGGNGFLSGGGGVGGGGGSSSSNRLVGHIKADGLCQESPNHFFAFYVPPFWQSTTMGMPPVRNNDFTFQEWSQHARYADAKPLAFDEPHYYWQAGAPKGERFAPIQEQSFLTRDLNTTLAAPYDNFFVFHVQEQKGIQCRFGERGVTAATHYDAGQNMIAMLTGAKRYILSPPKACPDLGVFSSRQSPIFRHSLLNFAHLQYLNDDTNVTTDAAGEPMSKQERAWLERAAKAPALETVLKAGEVLFLPSFWFHYIVSLQKSAQCNVRSGIDQVGTTEFGNIQDINECGSASKRGNRPF